MSTQKKPKIYVLTVSRQFLQGHPRAGQPTYFIKKILNGVQKTGYYADDREIVDYRTIKKIHTIRGNYPLWEKRIKEVQEGRAILSVRYWTGKPYKSNQCEILKLRDIDGVGIDKLTKIGGGMGFGACRIENSDLPYYDAYDFCSNDGLNISDFLAWFKSHDMNEPLAIIHFTPFRYSQGQPDTVEIAKERQARTLLTRLFEGLAVWFKKWREKEV